MQQSCRRRNRGGEGEVVPRGQAVAHFSFAVGVCSFRFFMERKRARERVRWRLRAERGRHFRQIYSRAGRLSSSRGKRGERRAEKLKHMSQICFTFGST